MKTRQQAAREYADKACDTTPRKKKARVTFEQPEKRHAKSEELFDKFLNNTSQEEIDSLVGVEPEAAGQEQETSEEFLKAINRMNKIVKDAGGR